MKFLSLLLVIFFGCSSAIANFGSYRLPITRDGVTKTMLAYNAWSGEYPGPVIDVPKNLTVVGYESLRKLETKKSCKVKKGLYHPWGKAPSLINFYTITDVLTYEATELAEVSEVFSYDADSTELKIDQILKGETVTNINYGSEGWCSGTLVDNNGQESSIEFFCDDIMANENIMNLTPEASYDNDEQWLYLKCEQGGSAFILDRDFLNSKGVKEGTITGYGEVSSQ